jgi:hypothetical protein
MVGTDLFFNFSIPIVLSSSSQGGVLIKYQRVPQVANVFPIAPYFYNLCFGQS